MLAILVGSIFIGDGSRGTGGTHAPPKLGKGGAPGAPDKDVNCQLYSCFGFDKLAS